MKPIRIASAVLVLIVAGVLAWLFMRNAAQPQITSVPVASRLRDTATSRPASAIDITLSFESLGPAEPQSQAMPPAARLYLQANKRQPNLPKPGQLAPLSAGLTRVDLADFPDGHHAIYVLGSNDYAPQWIPVVIEDGQVQKPEFEVTLYRKRYVTLSYAYNNSGSRELTGSKVKTGRATLSHFGRLPFFSADWMLWQSADGYSPGAPRASGMTNMFGDTPMLEIHRHQSDFGFLAAPADATFDSLTEAPESGYSSDSLQAVPNQMLYCRVSGNSGKAPDAGYAKILVESVSTTRPAGVKVVEPSYPN